MAASDSTESPPRIEPCSDHGDQDQNHTDATLSTEPYRDDISSQPSLAEYEPRPIDESEDAAAAAERPRQAWKARLRLIWLRNKGMFLVLMAQVFAASMNVMTQVLEIQSGMHPFQILFARMSITAVASYLYIWYAKIPAPLGTRPILPFLVLRAVLCSGFFGVFGMYWSVQYLPLSEATVITFLTPIVTCYTCSWLIPGERFSRRQQLAAVVSLIGVVLIARPFSVSGQNAAMTVLGGPSEVDSYHHILATIVSFLGMLGGAGAYTMIRLIGKRAHALVSVTYFSSITTIISAIALAALPSVPFRFPKTPLEWALLAGLGTCGFLCQFLLTAGLSYVPPASANVGQGGQGSRATSMVYTQVLFALFFDKVIWGSTLAPISWLGSVVILACAIYVATMQESNKPNPPKVIGDADRFKDVDEEAVIAQE
ncbi:hypothetical protein N7495_005525 [Penicillium taxi]|uniref:uncharacterized protein n=1 Tax=Penicillium taxi TaxID=168475 RepID=UPI0025454439|nr:uncharacterized protein N7495_005525 [Penicillium taxi]KAJ5893834.1 hypothetical protein N7495_005525 [Penicillium taxi]